MNQEQSPHDEAMDAALAVFSRATQDIIYFAEEVLCVELWSAQKEFLLNVQDSTFNPEEDPKRVISLAGQGVGKCLTADSRVYTGTSQGLLTVAQAAADGECGVVAMDETSERLDLTQASATYQGVKPCVRLITRTGSSVGASLDHPVYTSRGWISAGEVREGDFLAQARLLPEPKDPLLISDRDVKLAAYLLSDGGTTTGVTFSQQPGAVLDEMRTLCDMTYRSKYDYGVRGERDFCRRWGFYGCKAVDKRMPAEFFGLDQRQLALFINRFWACDGYFNKDSGPEICLASEGLIDDLQTALLRFGIVASKKYKRAKCQTGVFDSWRLSVSGSSNLRAWRDSVGEVLGKEGQLPEVRAGNTNVDVVPDCRTILEDLRVSESEARNAGFRVRHGSNWSRRKTKEFCERFGDHKRASNDLFWTPVVEVKDLGEQEVYDLCVTTAGNFVANNLVVHNTFAMVIAALWRHIRTPETLTIITAPTERQCQVVFFAEMRRILRSAPQWFRGMFTLTASTLRMKGKDNEAWEMRAITASTPEAMQGLHAKDMTVLIEELSGIDDKIVEALKGTVSRPGDMMICISNPTKPEGELYRAYHGAKKEWPRRMVFDKEKLARETKSNGDPFGLVSTRTIESLEREYGRDSDFFRVRVLGQFPSQGGTAILPVRQVEAAMGHDGRGPGITNSVKMGGKNIKRIGIDFAGEGGDVCAVAVRLGNAIVELWSGDVAPHEALEVGYAMQQKYMWSDDDVVYVVDAVGIGQGMLPLLREEGKRLMAFGNNYSSPTLEHADLQTHAFFKLQELLGYGTIYIPDDRELLEQLTTRTYKWEPGGRQRLKVESKKDYKKRGFQSPDKGDAVVQCFACDDMDAECQIFI